MRENRSYGLMREYWETSPLLYTESNKIELCTKNVHVPVTNAVSIYFRSASTMDRLIELR
jgi:hypothetical protein